MTQYSLPRRRRALIVENEYLIAHDLEAAMQHALGFDDCDVAPNARRAHSLSMIDQPDIVVVDVCLEGGREGIEVARWLREMFDVPVIFVTSYSDADTVQRIRDLVPGAPVLAKPVYPECLADAIAELGRSRAGDPLSAAHQSAN